MNDGRNLLVHGDNSRERIIYVAKAIEEKKEGNIEDIPIVGDFPDIFQKIYQDYLQIIKSSLE